MHFNGDENRVIKTDEDRGMRIQSDQLRACAALHERLVYFDYWATTVR